ncbi:hypothetical protein PLICRDRAFT_170943 [Plicaturopsis crispa FD-325 SS-3]|nr:hypothetical protein PLICRDRAFT_170943 [Plicaturopsis crispa FD-325 SS-3]
MLGHWFNKPEETTADTAPKSSTSLPPQHVPQPVPDSAANPPERAFSTPHDAALAALVGKTRTDAPAGDALSTSETLGEGFRPGYNSAMAHSSSTHTHNLSSAFLPPLSPGDDAGNNEKDELLHDPFTGAELGILHNADATDDEGLWTHLARVSELQSEIAGLHVAMEGVGGEGRRADVDVGVRVGAEVAEEDEEAEGHRRRENEFAKLTDKFTGRKDRIDEIMNKLDALSQEVTLFHSLITPTIEFSSNPSTRNNTNDSSNTSRPIPQSALSKPTPRSSKPGHQSTALSPPHMSNIHPTPAPVQMASPPLSLAVPPPMFGEHGRHDGLIESPISVGGSSAGE